MDGARRCQWPNLLLQHEPEGVAVEASHGSGVCRDRQLLEASPKRWRLLGYRRRAGRNGGENPRQSGKLDGALRRLRPKVLFQPEDGGEFVRRPTSHDLPQPLHQNQAPDCELRGLDRPHAGTQAVSREHCACIIKVFICML
ncbi:unnamed protein product [Symbiodinium sp. CCMP2592]|nr:unnamed protein product [Symbiodinium sp. CCMP2592]